MTDREKAIVMAYTGTCMLVGEKLEVFYKYLEELFGRPVYTHELGSDLISNLIKEKSKDDFMKLCSEEEESRKVYVVQRVEDYDKFDCPQLGKVMGVFTTKEGAKKFMDKNTYDTYHMFIFEYNSIEIR